MVGVISREALAALLGRGGIAVVEALGPDFYDNSHLPGALNITLATSDDDIATLLPHRGRTVIVYSSADASQAIQVALRLTTLGYRDVRIFPDGKEGWAEAGHALETNGAQE